jgi:hypothetical protein
MRHEQSGAWRAILIGGLLAGTLDIAWACGSAEFNGKSAAGVLRAVASGWQGPAAFEGGAASAWLGLASHFGIMFVAAAVFVFASRRFPLLTRQWLLGGAVFGVAMLAVMHGVIVPLSAAPFTMPLSWPALLTPLLVHVFLVGLPIAWAARRA